MIKTKKYLFGFIWVIGLLISGSENNYMPFLNFFGVFLFLIASLGMVKKISFKRFFLEFIFYQIINRAIECHILLKTLRRRKSKYNSYLLKLS